MLKWNSRAVIVLLGLITPFWVAVGRLLVGAGPGWFMLMLWLMVPALLVPLAVSLMFVLRADVRQSGVLRRDEAVWMWLTHISWFLGGFFLADFGDTGPQPDSVFTRYFVANAQEFSTMMAMACATFGSITLLWATVLGMVRLAKKSPAATRAAEPGITPTLP